MTAPDKPQPSRRHLENVAILLLDLAPDCYSGLTDAVFGDEFARHRGWHVVVFIEWLQPISGCAGEKV